MSSKERASLIAAHNLDLSNLEFADRLGGIPVPSFGIVRSDIGFNKYGSISLIAGPELADPRKSRGNRAFSADV